LAKFLNGTDVRGKIVLCTSPKSPLTIGPSGVHPVAQKNVFDAGGAGLIFVQYTTDLLSVTDCNGRPCVLVDSDTGKKIEKYIDANRSPKVKIEPTRSITGQETLAPKVASFSSRGPSPDYADVIKPDIAAPGANILAATGSSYGIMSGTSMSAPHVSGIIALLKALHPNWSPAALKSAIVTTVPNLRYPVTISRTVTNVDEVDAVYHVEIQSPPGVKMEVDPAVLVFNAANKDITFQVKLSPLWRLQGDYTFGSLTWRNGHKAVRIPVAARMTIHDFYADVA
ncbi:hypothetical protein EJB05_16681, partial [Eragrostis curvula]